MDVAGDGIVQRNVIGVADPADVLGVADVGAWWRDVKVGIGEREGGGGGDGGRDIEVEDWKEAEGEGGEDGGREKKRRRERERGKDGREEIEKGI